VQWPGKKRWGFPANKDKNFGQLAPTGWAIKVVGIPLLPFFAEIAAVSGPRPTRPTGYHLIYPLK
jgi:hypothetical protein